MKATELLDEFRAEDPKAQVEQVDEQPEEDVEEMTKIAAARLVIAMFEEQLQSLPSSIQHLLELSNLEPAEKYLWMIEYQDEVQGVQ